MKRIYCVLLVIAIALSLSSCDTLDGLLQANVFGGFYTVSAADIKEASGDSEKISELAAQDPESFYKQIEKDPVVAAAVIVTIDTAIADPETTPAQVRELANIGANVVLAQSGGDEVLNNVGTVISSLISGEGEEPNIAAIAGNLFPGISVSEETGLVVTDQEAVEKFYKGFKDASAYYEKMNDALASGDTVDPAVAQNAVIVTLVSEMTGDDSAYGTYASANPDKTEADFLLGVLGGTVTTGSLDLADDATLINFDFETLVDTESSPIGNILSAAGLDLSALLSGAGA